MAIDLLCCTDRIHFPGYLVFKQLSCLLLICEDLPNLAKKLPLLRSVCMPHASMLQPPSLSRPINGGIARDASSKRQGDFLPSRRAALSSSLSVTMYLSGHPFDLCNCAAGPNIRSLEIIQLVSRILNRRLRFPEGLANSEKPASNDTCTVLGSKHVYLPSYLPEESLGGSSPH